MKNKIYDIFCFIIDYLFEILWVVCAIIIITWASLTNTEHWLMVGIGFSITIGAMCAFFGNIIIKLIIDGIFTIFIEPLSKKTKYD